GTPVDVVTARAESKKRVAAIAPVQRVVARLPAEEDVVARGAVEGVASRAPVHQGRHRGRVVAGKAQVVVTGASPDGDEAERRGRVRAADPALDSGAAVVRARQLDDRGAVAGGDAEAIAGRADVQIV